MRDETSMPDHYVERDGVVCAGVHVLLDMHGCTDGLDDEIEVGDALLECVTMSGAKLLNMHVRKYNPHGVSAVAVLEESHISIHTWPGTGYVAADVFMCGDANPDVCDSILQRVFKPREVHSHTFLRGRGSAMALEPMIRRPGLFRSHASETA